MTFLVTAALLVGLLVGAPVLAHMLRRGRAREFPFPGAALVPAARSVARERSRIEDRALLLVRGALIACLAVLGATPFVRCSRLALGRHAGASVALALVVDDSQSMRAKTPGGVRWERAIQAAHELFGSAHEGDAVSIVLAGKPARLRLSATTDLGAARRALDELGPSDRATDLDTAVQMARASLLGLSQTDKRVVLLSDLAGAEIADGEPSLWAPLPALAEPVANCGICSAERRGRSLTATVACTSANAAVGRTLSIVSANGSSTANAEAVDLAVRAGIQSVGLSIDPKLEQASVALSGTDAITKDDRAPIAAEAAALTIAVNSDTARAMVETGGPPVLEQALASLDSDASVHALEVLPDDARDLQAFAAVIIDDPAGITPEARAALSAFVERGGVAVAFLGPSAGRTPLGSTLEPFARGAVHWDTNSARGANVASFGWLGPEAPSLSELAPHGRAGLAATDLFGARIIGTWSDGQPLIAERRVGSGLVYTLALPATVDQSDLPLRPGFIALLDHFVSEARARRGSARSRAGSEWVFPAGAHVSIAGPDGPLELVERPGPDGVRQKAATPAQTGRYTLRVDDLGQERVVALDPAEITTPPRALSAAARGRAAAANPGRIDASPELGWALLGLLALELVLRTVRLRRRRGVTFRDSARVA